MLTHARVMVWDRISVQKNKSIKICRFIVQIYQDWLNKNIIMKPMIQFFKKLKKGALYLFAQEKDSLKKRFDVVNRRKIRNVC